MSETVAEKFWRESREEREWQEETDKLKGMARLDSVLKHVFTADTLSLPRVTMLDFKPQELDEWLAEDNPHRLSNWRVPGVREALGLNR